VIKNGHSMRRALGTILFAVVLVAGTAVPGTAQTVTATFEDLRAEAYKGQTVYIADQAGTTVKGRVVRISATSLELLVNGEPRTWPVSDVAWIAQRHRHAGRGALVGLAMGACLGTLIFAANSEGEDAGFALVLAGVFGGIGGGAGAAIGAAARSERVLYAARPARRVLAPLVAPGVVGVRAQFRF
jgi:hypothetical protein